MYSTVQSGGSDPGQAAAAAAQATAAAQEAANQAAAAAAEQQAIDDAAANAAAGAAAEANARQMSADEIEHDNAVATANTLSDPNAAYSFGINGVGMGAGTVSNSALMIWLQTRTQGLNFELRDLMNGTDQRAKLVEDLTNLKAMIDGHAKCADVQQAIDQLLAQYEGTPYGEALKETLGPMSCNLGSAMNNGKDKIGDIDSMAAQNMQESVQGKIDALQKQDQIDMIYIQDYTSRIREGIQLVSNMVSGANQTSMSIVGNVGR